MVKRKLRLREVDGQVILAPSRLRGVRLPLGFREELAREVGGREPFAVATSNISRTGRPGLLRLVRRYKRGRRLL
jgi:hypothetical protein